MGGNSLLPIPALYSHRFIPTGGGEAQPQDPERVCGAVPHPVCPLQLPGRRGRLHRQEEVLLRL